MTTNYAAYSIETTGLTSWEELVGDFQLVGESGRINVSPVYVDSWVVALVLGVAGLALGLASTIEIPEEREPLSFGFNHSEAVVRYASQSTEFASVATLTRAVLDCARRLIDEADALGLSNLGASYRAIARFVHGEALVPVPDPEASSAG